MTSRRFVIAVSFILSALIITGCAETTVEPTSVGLANPAAVYCTEQGYLYEIRMDTGGG